MANKQRKYKRLPGRLFTLLDVRSLWQGPDHLLWVERVFFKENYKRFFYNDIQSVILQRTDTHMIWSFVWGALALTCGLIAFLVPGTPYVSATFTASFFLALGINLAWGPSCTVYLQTAAQVQKISSLKRVRTAQKAMDRVKELVEAVQGTLEKQNGMQAPLPASGTHPALTPAAGTPAALAQRSVKADPVGPFNPLLHQVSFGLLLALGAIGFIQMTLKSLPVAVVETLLHGVVQIMVIIALVRWYRHLKGTLTIKISWLALFFISMQTIIGYGIFLAVSFSNPQINYHHWAMFKKMFELQWIDHPLALAGNLIYTGGDLLLGIGGMIALRRRPRALTHGPENGKPKTAAQP
jgi:hypothetical protein